MKNLILNPENKESIIKFLQEPSVVIAETLTGMLANDKKDWQLVAARLVQSVLKVKLFTQFGRELKNLREAGKIKEDYFATNNQRASLLEFLKFIDDEVPDEGVFRAAKSIFFTSISKDATEKEELLGYQLLKICKKLGSGEILTLKAVYEIFNKKDGRSNNSNPISSADAWLSDVSAALSLPMQIIELFENKLIELKLISKRTLGDNSGIIPTNYRLTDLGIKMCEFIANYQ